MLHTVLPITDQECATGKSQVIRNLGWSSMPKLGIPHQQPFQVPVPTLKIGAEFDPVRSRAHDALSLVE